jgi:hypothetical protein
MEMRSAAVTKTPRKPRRSRRCNDRTWPAGPATAIARRTQAFFDGLRLHLVCTPSGLPITFALANPKVDERDVAVDMFDHDPTLFDGRDVQTIVADNGYASREFGARLHTAPESSPLGFSHLRGARLWIRDVDVVVVVVVVVDVDVVVVVDVVVGSVVVDVVGEVVSQVVSRSCPQPCHSSLEPVVSIHL